MIYLSSLTVEVTYFGHIMGHLIKEGVLINFAYPPNLLMHPHAVLDRDRFSDRDREREREWQKVPGTGINRERE